MNKNIPYFLPGYEEHLAIIANGQFPKDAAILTSIMHSTVVIACDGAIHNLHKHNIRADYAIGDGDSATIANPSIIKHPYIHIEDQNSSDLSKAFNFAITHYPQLPVIIYAASGLREDHSIANISLLMHYAARHASTVILSDYGIFNVLPAGTTRLTSEPGQQISFFCFNPETKISCPELKWPLAQFRLPYFHCASLNQATAASLTISVTAPIIIYRAFEIKNN